MAKTIGQTIGYWQYEFADTICTIELWKVYPEVVSGRGSKLKP